jgi:amino acid permease
MEKYHSSNESENGTRLGTEKTSIPKHMGDGHSTKSGVEISEGTVEAAVGLDPYGGTKRGLRSRHAQMIALGGAIGSG